MYTWIILFFAFLQVPSVAPIPYQPRLFGFRIHNRHSIIKIKLENVGHIVLHSVCCLYATNNRYSLVCFFCLFLHIHFLLLLYICIYTCLHICIFVFIYSFIASVCVCCLFHCYFCPHFLQYNLYLRFLYFYFMSAFAVLYINFCIFNFICIRFVCLIDYFSVFFLS